MDIINWEKEENSNNMHNACPTQTEEIYSLSKDEQTMLDKLMDTFQQQDPLIPHNAYFEYDDDVSELVKTLFPNSNDGEIKKLTEYSKDEVALKRISFIIHEQKITDINKYLLLQLYYDWKREKDMRERY